MNKPSSFPNACIYALRLHAPTAHARAEDMPAMSGQLEHVMSGRRYEFSTDEQLLAFLALELGKVATALAPQARDAPAPFPIDNPRSVAG